MGFSLPRPGKKIYWLIAALFVALIICGATRDCGAACPEVTLAVPECPDCVCPECPTIDEEALAQLLASYCPAPDPAPDCEPTTIRIERPTPAKYNIQGGAQTGATGDGGLFAGFTWYPKGRVGLVAQVAYDFDQYTYACTKVVHDRCYHQSVTTEYDGAERARYFLGAAWAF